MKIQLVCAHAVLRALEIANRRTKRLNRSDRFARFGRHNSGTLHNLHTECVIAEAEDELDALLAGVWALLDLVLVEAGMPDPDRTSVTATCDRYTRDLILRQEPHRPDVLASYLARRNAVA